MSKEFYIWLKKLSTFEGSEVAITPETAYIQEELNGKLSECIMALPLIDLYILDMRADDKPKSYEEIAERLSMSSAAAKQRMYRIKHEMQKCLEREYDWKNYEV